MYRIIAFFDFNSIYNALKEVQFLAKIPKIERVIAHAQLEESEDLKGNIEKTGKTVNKWAFLLQNSSPFKCTCSMAHVLSFS